MLGTKYSRTGSARSPSKIARPKKMENIFSEADYLRSLDPEKSEHPKKIAEKSVAGTFLGLKKTHMLETSYARNPVCF